MTQKVFRELVSVEEAKRLLRERFEPRPLGVESITLESAVGRVLGEDVIAEVDVPPFDRASMDGYAIRAEDSFGAEEDRPVTLKVVGKVMAGEASNITVNVGEAVEISTGAPMPKGANAVVMVEYTSFRGGLKVYRSVVPGENIMASGADIMAGELVLRRGDSLTPRETGVLAAIGRRSVKVYLRPRVAIMSTGNEIVRPGEPLEFGKIYDINGRALADSVAENGGEPIFLGIVGDREEEIRAKVREALAVSDMVLTSGGTSAGVGDLLYRIIDDLGPPGILVHGIAVRPGKPAIIGMAQGKPVFGLPGYPTSALMIFNVFVRPVLREMAGLPSEVESRLVEAVTAERIFSSGGRREYMSVNLVQMDTGGYIIYPVPGGSGAITTLAEADGFIEIPEGRVYLDEGEKVSVELFSQRLKPADLMIIGSNCVGIDVILSLMRERHRPYRFKVISTGSSGGLVAIRRGEADIAGTHLLDAETGVYNTPFLRRFEIADKAILVRGYNREQGLVVARGNPKGIKGIDDLTRPDVSIINRNPGSGTRILLDMKLTELAKERGVPFETLVKKIQGYTFESKSHSAVAVSVLQGRADVGLAIRAVAETYSLDFIPVAQEHYDFLIRKERLEKPSVQAFLEVLRSKEFREVLPKRAIGLTPTNDIGTVLYRPPNV
jgi:putative molybdopterin biosynthesis protein